jgi:hypothetical protein
MRQRYSDQTRLLVVLFAIFGLVIWLFWAENRAENRPPSSITVVQWVGSGSVVFLLRFPEPSDTQEEIIIHEESVGTPPRMIRRPVDTRNVTPDDYTIINQLTPEQWQIVRALRQNWCQDTPTFRELKDDEPFFDLGLRCNNALDRRHIQIPVDELPPELVQLIETVPSANCADPFCDWRSEVME